jgi:5-methylcytosine-specific restriction endonuclease McrA
MYISEGKFYSCRARNCVLNPDKENKDTCKYFETKMYRESEIYSAALLGYCEKMKFPDHGKQALMNLTNEEKKKKCIELNLIADYDLQLINNKQDIYESLKSLPEEENPRQTEEYLLWQKEVFRRDNYKCRLCGSNKNLNAHHLNGFARYPDLRYDINNGITLCEKHHNIKFVDSFHNIYGTKNFTKEDFYEYETYLIQKRNGIWTIKNSIDNIG